MLNANTIIIIGNLTKDPVHTMTGNGTDVVRFTIAVNEGEHTSFIDCRAFKQQAIFMRQYAHKGDSVLVQGRLRQERWEKDGKQNSMLLINADRVSVQSRERKAEDSQPQDEENCPF